MNKLSQFMMRKNTFHALIGLLIVVVIAGTALASYYSTKTTNQTSNDASKNTATKTVSQTNTPSTTTHLTQPSPVTSIADCNQMSAAEQQTESIPYNSGLSSRSSYVSGVQELINGDLATEVALNSSDPSAATQATITTDTNQINSEIEADNATLNYDNQQITNDHNAYIVEFTVTNNCSNPIAIHQALNLLPTYTLGQAWTP
jgi:predicted RND superfamily exporter protein